MNQGLVIISPILLVRLLTVEEFGRYREFLLYAGLLTTFCAFGINNSLLYFIPARPHSVRTAADFSSIMGAMRELGVLPSKPLPMIGLLPEGPARA